MDEKCNCLRDPIMEQLRLSNNEYEEFRAKAKAFMAENAYSFKDSSFGYKFNV